jgi:hypothetical protein
VPRHHQLHEQPGLRICFVDRNDLQYDERALRQLHDERGLPG